MYHLSSQHPDEYKIVNDRNRLAKDESNKENDSTLANTSTDSYNNNQPTTSTTSSTNKYTFLKNQCVNLVTVHGRPFSIIEDLAFKNIISMTGISPREAQSLNSHSIKMFVSQAAEIKRSEIAAAIKGRMISLKVDSATRLDRSFFAVNAQYILDGKILVKNLGVTELYARSTAEYLKDKLLYIMRKYCILEQQIYSITTDNGANMIKMTQLLNDGDNDSDEDDTDTEPLEILLNNNVYDVDNTEPEIPYSVTSIRCAAHTLQLAVNDALQEDESIHTINEARSVVRKLRTPTMRNMLKASNKNKPLLDVATRWHSTLDMLERLVDLKEYCSQTPGEALYVSPTTWDALNDLITSLKPAKILTKVLQREQLTIGDFYYHWSKCYLETSRLYLPLAQFICKYIKIREKQLMLNPTFVSALYLDPRFNVVLSADEEALANKHLNMTWRQILKVEAISMPVPEDESSSTSQLVSDAVDEMESILAETEKIKYRNRRDRYVQTHANITALLENFSCHPRIPPTEDILTFWKNKAVCEPQLFRLATTVLATPATQVSVERFFSSLKFILSDLRYNLNDNIVEDILVLRNNS